MMARRFLPKQKQQHAQQQSQSRYLGSTSVASSMEDSLKSALNSCGASSFSSDSLFHHLSSSGSEESHLAPDVRRSKKVDSDVEYAESKFSSLNDPLVIKLAAYEARGWISRSDYMYYRKLLKSKDHRHQVQSKLAEVAAAKQQDPASDAAAPPSILYKDSNASSATSLSSAAGGKPMQHVSWEDQASDVSDKENAKARLKAAVTGNALRAAPPTSRPLPENPRPPRTTHTVKPATNNKITPTLTNAVLLEPSEYWKGNAPLNDHHLRKLFVEMCFFARLGFVQPPCCLKCVYSQVVVNGGDAKQDKKKSCRQWVVWRKNASVELHPNKLDSNVVILQCHAAGALLEGKLVESRSWNVVNRKLVRMQ